MAYLLKANGQKSEFNTFTLEAMQQAVRGYIQIVPTRDNHLMVMNEEGKLMGLPENDEATNMVRGIISPFDVIVGDVIICDRSEMEGDGIPHEDEE